MSNILRTTKNVINTASTSSLVGAVTLNLIDLPWISIFIGLFVAGFAGFIKALHIYAEDRTYDFYKWVRDFFIGILAGAVAFMAIQTLNITEGFAQFGIMALFGYYGQTALEYVRNKFLKESK